MASALEDLVGQMTLTELAARSGKSVTAIVEYATGGATKVRPQRGNNGVSGRRAAKPSASPRRSARASGFDERVLEAVKNAGGRARSVDIEAVVGGTPAERRDALKRLVKARALKREGVARATTYSVR